MRALIASVWIENFAWFWGRKFSAPGGKRHPSGLAGSVSSYGKAGRDPFIRCMATAMHDNPVCFNSPTPQFKTLANEIYMIFSAKSLRRKKCKWNIKYIIKFQYDSERVRPFEIENYFLPNGWLLLKQNQGFPIFCVAIVWGLQNLEAVQLIWQILNLNRLPARIQTQSTKRVQTFLIFFVSSVAAIIFHTLQASNKLSTCLTFCTNNMCPIIFSTLLH